PGRIGDQGDIGCAAAARRQAEHPDRRAQDFARGRFSAETHRDARGQDHRGRRLRGNPPTSGGTEKLLADRRRARQQRVGGAMTTREEVLTVRGLNVSYGESKVLFDVDLSVRKNEVVACVGRNGAGKTTLLRSIAGFLKPLAGSITSEH